MKQTPNLDRRIDLQRRAQTQSASGAPRDTWADLITRLASSYRPLSGSERSTAPQWIASEQVEFMIRWRADLAALNPKDRVIYPAIMDGLSPADEVTEDRVFDIMEVHEVERRAWVQIKAVRRADGGAL